MKKRKVVAVSMAFVLSLSLAGCGGNKDKKGTEAASKDHPQKIEVAILDGMAPYTYTDKDGKFQGYDYEFLKKCDEMMEEYNFHYNSVDADAASAAVQAGTYAISCSAHMVTPARQKNFLLTIPEVYYPVNLISRTEDSFTKFEDLDGQTVVPDPPNDGLYVVLHDMAKEHPEVKFTQEEVSDYVSWYDCTKGVADGTWDVWVGGESMFYDIMKQEKMDLFCSEPIVCAPCIAVINKEYQDFRDRMNECIVEMYKDGTLKELSEKWLGKDYIKVAKDTGSLFDYDSYTKDQANVMNEK